MYKLKPKLHERQKNYVKGSLRSIALDVTAKCNMSCNHCYAETFVQKKPVDLDVLKKTIDESYQMGVFHYVLQGGEAIMDESRLEKIISMIYPDETYINVVSNGWDMTSSRIKWLKALKVDKICFSLDSGIAENHDKNRIEGSYQKVLAAIDKVLYEGLDTSVSCVVSKDFTKTLDFKQLYEFVKSKKIKLDVQIAMPVGKWDGNLEVLAKPEDISKIKELQLESPLLKNGQQMIKRDIFSSECDHCPAGVEFMGISVDGNLLPCNFLQFTLGNIEFISIRKKREELIKNIWFNGNQKICLVGENREFIDNYITPYVGMKKPLDISLIIAKGELMNDKI